MMPELVHILGLPFLACLIMGSILGYLGIHVLKREVIFIDIALAQIAAVGSIAAHLIFEAHADSMLGYACSLGCVLLAAGFYSVVRRRVVQISLEAVVGISYAVGAGIALFLVGIAPGGHMHVQTMLSGSLLWTTWHDIRFSFVLFCVVGFSLYALRQPFGWMSDNYRNSHAKGITVVWWDFLFYVLLGVVITQAVQIAGVAAVFGFLIIPATISAQFSATWTGRTIIAWMASTLASIGGLLFAYYLDISLGPSVVLFLGVGLAIIAALKKIR